MERCSFFNAELNGETYDRVYLAEDFARYFSSFIGNGVFPNPATGLQVVADNKSMNVIVRKGKAWINGYFYENTDDLTLQVNVADGVLNRIDKVVLRLDFLNREIKAYIKQGNFASTPASPAITRNSDIYELALADIKIDKGAIKITQAAIIDLRFNKELCGVVKGTVEEIDTTNLFAKFEQGFKEWFEHMKGTLEGDVAANLANKINKNTESINELFTNVSNGKTLVANAIADKGVSASNSDTFSQLATKIGQISTGKRFASGTGKTATLDMTSRVPQTNILLDVNNLDFTPSKVFIKFEKSTEVIRYKKDVYFNLVFKSNSRMCLANDVQCPCRSGTSSSVDDGDYWDNYYTKNYGYAMIKIKDNSFTLFVTVTTSNFDSKCTLTAKSVNVEWFAYE